MGKKIASLSLAFILLFISLGIIPPTTVHALPGVAQYGQIKVSGNQLVSQSGQPIQLKGMSSHGLQWYGGYVNKDSIKWLRDDWGINVFRAAMYTSSGGYISNPSVKEKVKEAVEAAIDLGIYVIIDWHILSDNDPNMYKQQSKEFFREMATLYGHYPNVIYEIANEPNGSNVTWNNSIKPYAEEVIPVIRAIDPDNIIIVGTGTWSQDIHHAADNPLNYSNIMYALHFYAGTHGQFLRDRIDYAMNKGAAIFVSEWGTSDASGNGGPYLTQAKQWTDFMDSRKLSWANWSLADKAEASAALLPGASTRGGWTTGQLSASGNFVRDQIRGSGTITPPPTVPSAPTGVTAIAGNAQVNLSWNAVSGATSYNVKRRTSATSGSYTTVATGLTTPTFTNTALTNGTTYYYVVTAVNSAGESSNSTQVSATPTGSPTPPSSGNLVIQYRAADTNATDNQMKPHFRIVNNGSSAINMSDLTIRYWYTIDGEQPQTFTCDWAQIGCSNIQGSFVKMGSAKAGADHYIEIKFTGGTISAGGYSGEIQTRINKNNWSNFNESNDYSFDPTKTGFSNWNRVTLYQNGTLIYGIEP
ncbi:cellulase family glycosylhydrolase [Bacillus alkalicellulosilyticus]|uniref:cellulase family glycosylhydrolase n=1 Tax=Alkalihalobacterium alkalicellulosilyticum TaxID=1912214 RepID=UPI0009970A46|nr:cellulase family glycosylhydrolase [Bacillus alkalicellulosilyticus]